MDNLEVMVEVCNNFKNKNFGIEEFQSRIETIIVPDAFKESIGRLQLSALNRLEEIRFCCLETDFQKYGDEVANSLLNAAMSQKTETGNGRLRQS